MYPNKRYRGLTNKKYTGLYAIDARLIIPNFRHWGLCKPNVYALERIKINHRLLCVAVY